MEIHFVLRQGALFLINVLKLVNMYAVIRGHRRAFVVSPFFLEKKNLLMVCNCLLELST